MARYLLDTNLLRTALTRNEADFARIAQHDNRLRFAQEPS